MRVGPVLQPGAVADAIVAAIRELNADVQVVDRGAYLRVSAPDRCRVTRAQVERHAGGSFRLPQDLEQVMSSFMGRFFVSPEEARWEA